MSLGSTGLPAGLAATGMANAPSWVRNGSAEMQKNYALGLQFEAMLANELARSMTATAGLGEQQGGEEEGGASSLGAGAGGPFSTMISGAMAEGVGGGRLGLAAEIARDLQSRTGTAPGSPGTASESATGTTVAGGAQAETTGGASA